VLAMREVSQRRYVISAGGREVMDRFKRSRGRDTISASGRGGREAIIDSGVAEEGMV
jgi:hypothetical protein